MGRSHALPRVVDSVRGSRLRDRAGLGYGLRRRPCDAHSQPRDQFDRGPSRHDIQRHGDLAGGCLGDRHALRVGSELSARAELLAAAANRQRRGRWTEGAWGGIHDPGGCRQDRADHDLEHRRLCADFRRCGLGVGEGLSGELGDGSRTPYAATAVRVRFPSGCGSRRCPTRCPTRARWRSTPAGTCGRGAITARGSLPASSPVPGGAGQGAARARHAGRGSVVSHHLRCRREGLQLRPGQPRSAGRRCPQPPRSADPGGRPARWARVALTSSWGNAGALMADGDY